MSKELKELILIDEMEKTWAEIKSLFPMLSKWWEDFRGIYRR